MVTSRNWNACGREACVWQCVWLSSAAFVFYFYIYLKQGRHGTKRIRVALPQGAHLHPRCTEICSDSDDARRLSALSCKRAAPATFRCSGKFHHEARGFSDKPAETQVQQNPPPPPQVRALLLECCRCRWQFTGERSDLVLPAGPSTCSSAESARGPGAGRRNGRPESTRE